MQSADRAALAHLIHSQPTAAFGTLRDGGPLVSLILFVPAPDFNSFYIHASRLAHHTQDLLADPRVSLMIAENDPARPDPQTLARISLRGAARRLAPEDPAYNAARQAYLAKYPAAIVNFSLPDFDLYVIEVRSARFVAGFGRIYNLNAQDLRLAAAV
jgi:hypothetical protein